MAEELKLKFKFNTSVRTNKGKQIIVINSESYPLFRKEINPFIIPEMLKKLP
jgi:hypothetical protein